MRRAMWPMREVLQKMQREPHECFSEITRTYIRDVYDHAIQIIDIVETYREVASGLTETYMTAMSNRMNEIMKVLTIMGTIFIPLTFLAGVYGMNFHHFPELDWPYAYPLFWADLPRHRGRDGRLVPPPRLALARAASRAEERGTAGLAERLPRLAPGRPPPARRGGRRAGSSRSAASQGCAQGLRDGEAAVDGGGQRA